VPVSRRRRILRRQLHVYIMHEGSQSKHVYVARETVRRWN
jgi:hypothetical protein